MEGGGGGGGGGAKKQKLNVGGKLFETTSWPVGKGSCSISMSMCCFDSEESDPVIFFDRDPALFSALLSILRTGSLHSSSSSPGGHFPTKLLVDEAIFYGLDPHLILRARSPPPLLGYAASLSSTISPPSEPFPTTALSAAPDGSLCLLAHGSGQITSYSSHPSCDHRLAYSGTFRAHLDCITSLRFLSPRLAALGSLGSPGLHFYHLDGTHVGSVHWSDPSDLRVHKAKVTAIAALPAATGSSPVLASFECPHRENCILAVDPVTLQVTAEIGRQRGSAAKSAAAGRLAHVQEVGLVFASAVSSGAFGYSGYMRLWDPRSGEAVWETSEPGGAGRSSRFGDPFADADVDTEQLAIYKVCSKSGDVGLADLRCLGDDPWLYLSSGPKRCGGGHNSVLHCYNQQVFVSREDGLEVWSRLEEPFSQQKMGHGDEQPPQGAAKREGICGSKYRMNYLDTEEDARRGTIQMMEGGGDRLFVSREGMPGVQVWETSHLAGAIALS